MFLICGFTVTPIAAAEFAGVNERAYVAAVVRECYPELTDKEIAESVDTAYQMLATEEFQTAVSESEEDIKRLAENAIVNSPNPDEVASVFSGFSKQTWYLVKSVIKQTATVWKKGHLSDLAGITTYILLNPAEKISSPEAVDDTLNQLSQFVTVPAFEQMYQNEILVLAAKIAWIIMLCCVVGVVITCLLYVFDIILIPDWLCVSFLVLFGLTAVALLIIEIIDDVRRYITKRAHNGLLPNSIIYTITN